MSTKTNASQASPLEAHLGYWLRFVSNQVSQGFALKVASQGVTVAEWVFLRELFDHRSAMPSELAARLGMTRGAISKLSGRLTGKAFIKQEANREDFRSHSLSLTAKGRALVPKLSALADQNDEEFFGHLAPSVRTVIESAMREMVRRHSMLAAPIN